MVTATTDMLGVSDRASAPILLAYADADSLSRWPGKIPGTVYGINTILNFLDQAGFTVWHRHGYLPEAADPEVATSRATEACDNYVMLLSAQTLTDTLCLQGLLFAISMNKRIVPLQVESIDHTLLPEPLQAMAKVELRQPRLPLTNSQGGRHLLRILHHDALYHRLHTQVLVKALAWERHGRPRHLLLQGDVLQQYYQWMILGQKRTCYQPIQLQTLYLAESLGQGAYRLGKTDGPLGDAQGATEPPLARVGAWLTQWLR